ncbi:MAG: hypothetical protein AAFY90_03520 [Pseudomonadota bacterium]
MTDQCAKGFPPLSLHDVDPVDAAEDGGDMPPDILGSHHLNHFEPGLGLILMALGDPGPPVRSMVLAPLDPEGYAIRPAD